jgi:hypothetical protein
MIKDKKMNYFVIDFKKIENAEAYKNVIVGHNFRQRTYKQNPHNNINPKRTKDNIILSPLLFRSERELMEYAKKNLKKGKRQIRKNAAKAFSIVVDCSEMDGWTENDYIRYLEAAHDFLIKRFTEEWGLLNLGATIHMDEKKPHLHIAFSYFSEKEGAWIQKKLKQKNVTDLNKLLNDFEKEVGKKFNLTRGKGEINKPLKKELSKHVKTLETRKFIFFKEQHKIIESKDAVKAIKSLNDKHKKALYENENLKQKLTESNNRIKELETYKSDFLEAVERIKTLERELKTKDKKITELESKVKEKEQELENKTNEISQLEQALLREREKRLGIQSQFPEKTIKRIRQDYGINR